MEVFHSFRLDGRDQCLWGDEQRVALPPKAFGVLRYLVEHPGRLVTQDEILQALWPEVFVNPEVVKKYILEIRKVLGDSYDKPVFIATFPKRGYQFVAPLREDSGAWRSDSPSDSSNNVVSREIALAKLDRHLEEALRGKRQIVFVTGEAAVGKNTLIYLFHRRVVDRR